MTFLCQYSVTMSDFCDSMRAYRKVARGAAFRYRLDVVLLPALGAAALFVAAFAFHAGLDWWQWPAFVGAALLIVLPASYHMHLRSAFRARVALAEGRQVETELTPTEAIFRIPDQARIAYPWKAFTSYCQGRSAFTLLIGTTVFHSIPQRAMTPEFHAFLISQLRTHAQELPC